MPSLWRSGAGAAGRATTGRQSIRGRISGPIPIPAPGDDEFPIRNPGSGIATTSAEDEFPIRHPGSTIASTTPLPGEGETEFPHLREHQQGQTLLPPAGSASPDSDSVSPPPADVTHSSEGGSPPHPRPAPPSASSSTPARSSPQISSAHKNSPSRAMPIERRNNTASTLRYSSLSETPTGVTGRSRDGAPERKKSVLRTALGKLFGRRKKHGGSQMSISTSGRASGMLTSSQYRSDPTALNRCRDGSPKRSASLPITEYDRALRSHSIGPQDMTAIETARNSLQVDVGPAHHRRAATMSTRLFNPPWRNPEWIGLSPRPASTHGRASRLIAGLEDPNEIGRAITSDNEGGTRRRSRSLSGINDILAARRGQRRRSDEIRYWRESYDPGFMSPLSSNGPDTEAENNDTGLDGRPGSGAATDRPPKTPPQPFTFGSITTEMAGMKITQAASLDSRIGGLEARMLRLERVVTQLCHSVPGFKTPLMETPRGSVIGVTPDLSSFAYTTAAPPTIPAIYQNIPSEVKPGNPSLHSSDRQSLESDWQSHLSFGEAQTFIGSLHPPSSSATQTRSLTATAPPVISPASRPDSNSTIRGAASLPTMGRNSRDESTSTSGDDPGLIFAQLEAERLARQTLEAQVKKLSERLNTLSTTMYAMVRDPARSRSHEHLQPPSPSGQQQTKARSATVPSPRVTPAQKPALSVFEGDDDDDDDDSEGEKGARKAGHESQEADGEEAFGADFHSPREERPMLRYGAFGEELKADDDDNYNDGPGGGGDGDETKRKKAARTLSLSQLTLGKGAQVRI